MSFTELSRAPVLSRELPPPSQLRFLSFGFRLPSTDMQGRPATVGSWMDDIHETLQVWGPDSL